MWATVKYALGPARSAPRRIQGLALVISWVLPVALGALGLSKPDHFNISAAWWIALILVSLLVLFVIATYRLHSATLRTFPRSLIEADRVKQGFGRAGSTRLWVDVPVVLTNREPAQKLSLDFALKLVADGNVLLTYFSEQRDELPLAIGPMETQKYELRFDFPDELAREFLEQPLGAPIPTIPHQIMRLVVGDRVSGEQIEIQLPGRYPAIF